MLRHIQKAFRVIKLGPCSKLSTMFLQGATRKAKHENAQKSKKKIRIVPECIIKDFHGLITHLRVIRNHRRTQIRCCFSIKISTTNLDFLRKLGLARLQVLEKFGGSRLIFKTFLTEISFENWSGSKRITEFLINQKNASKHHARVHRPKLLN